MPRWARGKADSNHHELIEALRDHGWQVVPTYALRGFVDAVAYKPSQGVKLIEFKTPNGGLTLTQERLLDKGWPITVLRSSDDVAAFSEG